MRRIAAVATGIPELQHPSDLKWLREKLMVRTLLCVSLRLPLWPCAHFCVTSRRCRPPHDLTLLLRRADGCNGRGGRGDIPSAHHRVVAYQDHAFQRYHASLEACVRAYALCIVFLSCENSIDSTELERTLCVTCCCCACDVRRPTTKKGDGLLGSVVTPSRFPIKLQRS